MRNASSVRGAGSTRPLLLCADSGFHTRSVIQTQSGSLRKTVSDHAERRPVRTPVLRASGIVPMLYRCGF